MNYNKEIVKSTQIGEQYFKVKHPSGCTVCLYPMDGFSSTYAVFGVNFGSFDNVFKTDSDSGYVTVPNGTAHFLEHKLFEKQHLFAATGASYNAYTNFDKTTYLFYCSQKFEENLEILLKAVQEPNFTVQSTEKEKGVIEQEIAMYDDDPRRRAYLNGYRAAYREHPVRNPIEGTKDSVAKIDKELLYRCYNAFYRLDNTVLSIAGNFDADRALEICDRLLKPSDGKKGKIERPLQREPYEVKEKTVKVKLPCSKPMFEIIYKFPEMTPAEAQRKYVEYTVLNSLCFGSASQFSAEMYGQGLIDNSGFGAGAYYSRDLFFLSLSGDSDNPELLLGKINAEFTRLRENPPDRTLFENVKKAVYGGMLRSYVSTDMAANCMLSAEMSGLTAFDGIEIVSKITYEDILEALRGIDLENCSLSVVEPV